MENKILEAALDYHKKGLSVIPVKEDKKPLVKWEPYQKVRATEEEVRKWFDKNNPPNIAIVTGILSNLTVVDTDSQEATERIQSLIPDSSVLPIAQTPKGGRHFYFKYMPGSSNKARIDESTDIRSEGGYVVAAPSINGTGKGWKWVTSILDVDPPEIALSIKEIINTSLSLFSTRAREAQNKSSEVSEVSGSQQYWGYGTRDDNLFSASNYLIKSNCPPDFAENILNLIVNSWGENDPAWVHAKVKSAMDRAARRERNIAQELREWINESVGGQFKVSDWYKESVVVSKTDKHAAIVSLKKLCNEGIVERIGKRTGEYRIIEKDFSVQQWWDDEGEPLKIKFPLGVHDFVKIYPGNIILLEGQKSQGKSAFAIEFCRLNRQLFEGKIRYQNVEMSDSELRERFMSYPHDVMPISDWKESVEFIKRTSDWWDLIEPDSINVVDYLVEYEKSYLIAQFVFQIHQKLKNGIALIVVQRDPMKPYPSGGRAVRDIPRLIISLIHHVIKIEDVKSFRNTPLGNPTGISRLYKQINWWKFLGITDWSNDKPKDEKPERKSWVD